MELLDKIYSYSNKPTDQFEEKILNQQFKDLLEKIDENQKEQLEYNFLVKYALFIADNLDENIKDHLDILSKLLVKLPTQTIFRSFYTLLGLFLKEAYLGPSFTYAGIDKRIKQEKQEKQSMKKYKKFPTYNFQSYLQEKGLEIDEKHKSMLNDNINMLNLYNYKFVKQESFIFRQEKTYSEFLMLDGEEWGRLVPYTPVFIIFKHMIDYLQVERSEESAFFSLWAARIAYFYNNILYTPTGTLKEKVNKLYDYFFEQVAKEKYSYITKKQIVLLNVEYSNVLLFFYQYNSSQRKLIESQKLLGVSFNFTGKMGVRTKFQQFKVAQLVVEVKNDEEQKEVEKENQETLNPYEILKEKEENKKEIKNQQFDEECILYEVPKLDEAELKDYKSDLSIYDQIVIIGLIKNLEITNPHDEIYTEQVQAYCNILIDKSLNWLVFTNSLFIRSLNEFDKFKRMERALLQLQTLVDQFNDKEPNFLQRALYVFPLTFPSQQELYKIVASKYMKVGMLMTACDLFKKLEMFEECVECLAGAQQMQKAKEMALDFVTKNPESPRMLCIYGDLTGDFTYYKKAWKASKKRFARAQRSLGKVYFYQNKLEKAIKAFKKAVNINSLTMEPYFTMGCAYQKLQQWQNAIGAFSSCISINNTQSDAWANMANSFLQMGKTSEAYSTLEQAVKHNEGDWRMWFNLLQISFANKKFYKYFECIQRIVNLDKGLEVIDAYTLKRLNQIFMYQIQIYNKSTYKGPFNTIKNRIERLYVLMAERIGQQPAVWEYFADFVELSIEYYKQEQQYEISINLKKQQEQKKEEEEDEGVKVKFAVDTKPLFKSKEQIEKEYEEKYQKLLEKAYQLRQSACNVLMVAGWEDSVSICECLVPYVEGLINAHKNAKRGEKGDIEIKRFMNTVVPQLEKNLKKKMNFEF